MLGGGNNETDRLALLEFKAKITLDPLKVTSSWNNSIHYCQWQGVTCGPRHQRVTMLDLQSLKLVGSISPHVGNLSFLRILTLQNNIFHNEIPQKLAVCTNCESCNWKITHLVAKFQAIYLLAPSFKSFNSIRTF